MHVASEVLLHAAPHAAIEVKPSAVLWLAPFDHVWLNIVTITPHDDGALFVSVDREILLFLSLCVLLWVEVLAHITDRLADLTRLQVAVSVSLDGATGGRSIDLIPISDALLSFVSACRLRCEA